MINSNRYFLYFLPACIFLMLGTFAGCGGGGESSPTASLTAIQVTPATSEVSVGVKRAFTATGIYSDQTIRNLTSQATWKSSLITHATITSGGEATGVAPGTTAISATFSGVAGTAVLTVDSATLTGLQVSPAIAQTPVGTQKAFTAIGTYSDGDTHDLTSLVTWASDHTAFATVASTGVATGVSGGVATISAALGGFSGHAALTVLSSTLTSISVHPVNPEIAVGGRVAFTATGTYSDHHTADLTAQVSWTGSDPAIATLTAAGVASGVSPGLSTITATLAGVNGGATLRVDASKLTSIQVSPGNPVIHLRNAQPFKATGAYSDGDTKDITAEVHWSATNAAIATAEANGKATGLAAGATPIVAKLAGVKGEATLTVNDTGANFPTYPGNVFSIQYRNSSASAITVWFIMSKPPCSKAVAESNKDYCNIDHSDWAGMKTQITDSGTRFYIRRVNGTLDLIAPDHISNKQDLQPGEILRVIPPIVTGTDPATGASYTRPEWYYNINIYDEHHTYLRTETQTSGTTTWVTKAGITMPAPQSVMLFEFNLSAPLDKNIWYDIGAVDGLNANGTMTYTGCAVEHKKSCKTNISAYSATNDGCPYILQMSSANVCANPKLYPATLDASTKPSWVVSPSHYTTADVSNTYPSSWTAAGSPSGADMASAASGEKAKKIAYHIWWATNPVGQGWLKYLQKNSTGSCDAYGWAYDEKKWIPKDCNPNSQSCFDVNGNPPDNKDIQALINCPYSAGSYVNIDILSVM